MARIGMIVSEISGPFRNGGIGTAFYNMANLLVQAGHEIVVLYIADYLQGNPEYWKKVFVSKNIDFHSIDVHTAGENLHERWWNLDRSWEAYQWLLKQKPFDYVHFAELLGYSYHILQAKRTTGQFAETIFSVIMHGPSDWVHEGMEIWRNEIPRLDLMRQHMERYTTSRCDFLASPSKYLFEWAISHKWPLTENRKVMPNISHSYTFAETYEPEDGYFIFFGRLEKRKGLDIFCHALKKYAELGGTVTKVDFLGKDVGWNDGGSSVDYIRREFHSAIKYDYYLTLDTQGALNHMKATKGLVIMPSRLENYSCTITECIENGIPFLCTDVGGNSELASGEVLFDPTADSLLEKLLTLDEIDFTRLWHRYDRKLANQQWLEFHDKKHCGKYFQNYECDKSSESLNTENLPSLTVCCGGREDWDNLLPVCDILSRELPDSANFIYVDSSLQDKSKLLNNQYYEYKNQYNECKFNFFSHRCDGVFAALNEAAALTEREYILLMAAGVVPMAGMMEKLLRAAEYSDLDALTCYARIYSGDIPWDNPGKIMPCFGADPGASIYKNCFTAGSVILVKRWLFEHLGGFLPDGKGGSDWEFIMRLLTKGYTFDVIPEVLYWTKERIQSHNEQRAAIIAATAEMPAYVRELMAAGAEN